ncbi:hypothetical protein ACIRJS_32840 [Streptomyces sp. NPDC102340]|uniref:hypothetical protein n=1 Tax=unclassified Streptomyces TaxID=2593676 RepID=UPI0037FAC6DA
MIVHDLADLGTTLIGRAVLTVGATAGLGAALLVLAIVLISGAVTGMWTGAGRRTEQPTPEYDEAA